MRKLLPNMLVWQTASTYSNQFEEFAHMIESIGNVFPRFQDYGKLFSSERMNKAILAAYENILEFLILANKTFSTSGMYHSVE
jgi:hypothetical protein